VTVPNELPEGFADDDEFLRSVQRVLFDVRIVLCKENIYAHAISDSRDGRRTCVQELLAIIRNQERHTKYVD
jgi:hypothetical protein